MSRTCIAVALLGALGCSPAPAGPSTAAVSEPAEQEIPAPACAAGVSSFGTARFDVPRTLPAGRAVAVRLTDLETTTEASLTLHLMGPSGEIAKFPASAQPAFEHRWLLGCDYGSTPPQPPHVFEVL